MNPRDDDFDALMEGAEDEAKACAKTLRFRRSLNIEELALLSPALCRCTRPMISMNGSAMCWKCGHEAGEGAENG